jgi:hypothetical protein
MAMTRLVAGLPGAFVVRGAAEATEALSYMASGEVTELSPDLDPAPFSQQYQFDRFLARLDDALGRVRRRAAEEG